jgi:hypothetical protein
MTRPRVLLSYSHLDDLQKLLSYLAPLIREGLVDVWTDKDLRGGDRWQHEIEAALGAATIAVLLIPQNSWSGTSSIRKNSREFWPGRSRVSLQCYPSFSVRRQSPRT